MLGARTMNNHLILALFWVVYYGFHSALATKRAKRILGDASPALQANYRLLYSLFSAVNFALLFWFQSMLASSLLFLPSLSHFTLAIIFALGGIVVSIMAIRQYPLRFWFSESTAAGGELVESGLNRVVRHPIYSGFLLLILAYSLWQPYFKHVLFFTITLLYVLVSIRWEEKKLIEQYGNAYLDYRKRVKALIPYVF